MRKKLTIAILIVLLSISGVKPATALMIDASQIAAKISDYVNKIQDAVNKVVQQVNQVKLMVTQGFSLNTLMDIAKAYYGTMAMEGSNQQMSMIVEGTRARNSIILQDERDRYSDSAKALYQAKVDYVQKDKEQVKAELNKNKTELQSVKTKRQVACSEYENDNDNSEKYETCQKLISEEQTLTANVKELEALYNTLSKQETVLIDEQSKVGVAGDPVYDALQARLDAINASEDSEAIVMAEDTEEWGKLENMDNYQLNEADYQIFLKRYFYNPKETKDSGRQTIQSKQDALMRERRYLLVNSAAHLLQVSATVRREIPVRTEAIETMFQNTPAAGSELEAISSYAATRVENARVLLLYARLLSAKIQYMAARDLLDIEPKKDYTNKSYETLDLGRYVLTEEYVEEVVRDSNKTIDYSNIGK